MTWMVPQRPPAFRLTFGQSDVIAVGARQAVGHTRDAYVPAPPDSLTKTLFGDSTNKGVNLYKRQFFSPPNFELYPQVFQQHYDNSLVASGFGYYWCANIPNPPGNSS